MPPEVKMQPVDSEAIESIGYDAPGKVLHVKFKSGATYHHFDVSQEKYEAFLKADSKGKHFHAHIRNAHQFKRAA